MAGTAAGKGVARIDPRLPVRPSQRITLTVDAERLHFFDPETGHALGREQPARQEISA
jgi:multiple sugar transport system ATP-binding protein